MGNATKRQFIEQYKQWATPNRYTHYIHPKILKLIHILMSNRQVTIIEPVDSGTYFRRHRYKVPSGTSLRNYSTAGTFKIHYGDIKIIFHGVWDIQYVCPIACVCYGRSRLFETMWNETIPPTWAQIHDLNMYETSRYRYETTNEYIARMHPRPKVSGTPETACKEKIICAICYVHKPTEVMVPCGHTICPTCINSWNTSTCPFCRKDIEQTVHLFLETADD